MSAITKATRLTDIDKYIASLPMGDYRVSGEFLSISEYSGKDVELASVDDIRRVTKSTIIERYESADGSMSVDDYDAQKTKLTGNYLGGDGYDFGNDIDAEYAYKKFTQKWTAIRKEVYGISEPIPVSVKESVLDSGNPFIRSMFAAGGEDATVFVYNRQGAAWDALHTAMKSLGMEYAPERHHRDTNNKKLWGGNSLRFIVAFGTYQNWTEDFHSSMRRGPLEQLQAQYESDRAFVEKKVRSGYANHFTEASSVLATREIRSLSARVANLLSDVTAHKKSYEKLASARRVANKLLSTIDDSLSAELEKQS